MDNYSYRHLCEKLSEFIDIFCYRHLWDDEMVHWEYIETLDEETDIFYYETQSIVPSIKRDYLLLR